MQDLRHYSDQELSLIVFNDEYLYKLRRLFLSNPKELNDYFLYTDEQLEVLLQDIRDDLEN